MLSNNLKYLNEDQKALFNTQSNIRALFAESYNYLISGIENLDKEEFRKAWDKIKKAVDYKKPEILSTSIPSAEIKQPIQLTLEQKKPIEQQPINTASTTTTQTSTQIPTSTTSTTATTQSTQTTQQPVNNTEQNKQPERRVPQENTGIYATIRGVIGGFFSAVANTISNIADYIRSLFSQR
jgi:hypothetical protein